jgi:hypothetical protein
VRRAAVAVTAAVTLAAAGAGCGGDGPSRRDGVADYVRSANAVQQRHAGALDRADRAYRDYSNGELSAGEAARRTAEAEDAIRAARAELSRLRPPADARALHDRLMRVYELNLGMATETARLVHYLQGSARALGPLPKADRRLTRGLRAAGTGSDQAAVLERFRAAVRRSLGRLRALEAPEVLRSTHRDQVRRLESTQELARQLQAAVLRQDAAAIARLIERFRTDDTLRRTRSGLARRALRAYDHRLDAVRDAATEVVREQQRLERALG